MAAGIEYPEIDDKVQLFLVKLLVLMTGGEGREV